jgi:predicted permease
MFSIVNAVMLRPLPFPEAEQIVQIWDRTNPTQTIYPQGLAYKYWREESKLLEEIALSTPLYRTLTGGPAPERIKGLGVSANYLALLRMPPLLGQNFAVDAERPGGANKVVLLSHEMWQTRYGGDAGIVGRTISLDDTPFTVVGVMAPDSLPRDDTSFLVPYVHSPQALSVRPTARPALLVTARLKPGVTPIDAEAELTSILRAHANDFGTTWGPLTASVVTLREQLTGAARPTMMMLMGAGTLVLLIACANIANLLLARATARTKEIAVRSALGASTGRIVRQLLTENLLLTMLGCGLAALLALLSVDLLGNVALATVPSLASGANLDVAVTGGELPSILRPRVDWTVLSFAFAIATATGLGCGLFPALRACRADVNRDLKDGGRGTSSGGRTRTQSMLIAAEVALSVMLLIGAGLFLRSFANVATLDLGFQPQGLHAFDLSLPGSTYSERGRRNRFIEEILTRLSGSTGIESVSAATDAPFGSTALGGAVGLATETDRSRDLVAGHNYVDNDFFRTMGVRLLRGRSFTTADHNPDGPRAIILGDSLARALFNQQDPVGSRVYYNGRDWEVVGVAVDCRSRALEGGNARYFYLPFGLSSGRASILVRSTLPPRTLHETVMKNVRVLDPAQPATVRKISDGIGRSLRGRQTVLVLVNAFAAIALILACIGIYGVMAYTIGQRQRELSIRMALGASQPNVVGLVLRDGLRLSSIGLVAGIIGAIAGARLIAALLFGVSAHDPLVFATASCALAAIAAVACWLPARRAASADPMQALRAD